MTAGEAGIEHPGEIRTGVVRTSGGPTHLFCPPDSLEANLAVFMEWFAEGLLQCEDGHENPVIFAVQTYQRFVSLHPFENGNGRMARLLMDYIFERFDMPPPILGKDVLDALFPLDAKQKSQIGFIKKIIKGVRESKSMLIQT